MVELNDINAGVKQHVVPTVADNIFKKVFLFKRLLKKNRVEWVYGKDLTRYPIMLGSYKTYGHDNKYSPIKVEPTDILHYASIDFHTRYTTISLTRDEQKKIQSQNAAIDITKIKTIAAVMSLTQDIEKRLIKQTNDTDTPMMNSLEKIIDDGTSFDEYAGIKRSEVPQWKCQYQDKGGELVTYEDLSNMYQKCGWNTTSPTLVITTANLWTKINMIIFDKQKFTLDSDPDLGIPNYKVFGAPVISSPFVSPGTILLINEDYLTLFVDKEADADGISFSPFEKVDLSNKLLVAQWLVDAQLFSPAPRMHGKIVNVKEN